jgi:hypothetical protein
LPTSPVSANAEKPVPTESPITSAPALEAPDAPAWLLHEGVIEKEEAQAQTQGGKDAAEALLVVIVLLHSSVAKKTGYQDFRLDDEEKDAWRNLLGYLVKYLPIKDLPLIGAIAAIIMIEGGKLMGLMDWRKKHSAPDNSPPEKKEERKLTKTPPKTTNTLSPAYRGD